MSIVGVTTWPHQPLFARSCHHGLGCWPPRPEAADGRAAGSLHSVLATDCPRGGGNSPPADTASPAAAAGIQVQAGEQSRPRLGSRLGFQSLNGGARSPLGLWGGLGEREGRTAENQGTRAVRSHARPWRFGESGGNGDPVGLSGYPPPLSAQETIYSEAGRQGCLHPRLSESSRPAQVSSEV